MTVETKTYSGEAAWAYNKGYAEGEKDNRSARGVMSFGGMFAADKQTMNNTTAWKEGFADGQRSIGLDPEKTYCSKEEYPGVEGQRLKQEAEERAKSAAGGRKGK